jgi:hypothetical protein
MMEYPSLRAVAVSDALRIPLNQVQAFFRAVNHAGYSDKAAASLLVASQRPNITIFDLKFAAGSKGFDVSDLMAHGLITVSPPVPGQWRFRTVALTAKGEALVSSINKGLQTK